MTGKSANWVLGEPKDGAWDVNIVWSGSGFLDNIIDWGVGVVMVDHVILCHVALLDLPHVHRSILSGARQKSPVHTKPDGPYGAAMGLDLLAQVHRRELLLALPALPRFDPLRRHHAMVLILYYSFVYFLKYCRVFLFFEGYSNLYFGAYVKLLIKL